MISSAPAVGESGPAGDRPFDLRHAPAHLRIVCEALVQALVDEGPHPFRILRPPLGRKFAACLHSTPMVENRPQSSSSPCPVRPETVTTGGVQLVEAGVRIWSAARYSAAAAFARSGSSSALLTAIMSASSRMPFLIPCNSSPAPGQHQHEEEVGQVGHRRLRLPDADRLHQNHVETGRLAEQHGLAGLRRDAAERAGGGGGADEGVGIDRELRHPRLVAENRAAGAGRGRIDGQHRHLVAPRRQQGSQRVDGGGLADARARR